MDKHAIRSRNRLAGPKTDLIPMLEDALCRAIADRDDLRREVTDNIAGGIARVLDRNARASDFIAEDLVVLVEEFAQEFCDDVIEGAQAVWDDYHDERQAMAATGGE